MEGKEEPPELRGIIPNTFDYIFSRIGRESKLQPACVSCPAIMVHFVRMLLHSEHITFKETRQRTQQASTVLPVRVLVVYLTQSFIAWEEDAPPFSGTALFSGRAVLNRLPA